VKHSHKEKDEHLEGLWEMHEKGRNSVEDLEEAMNGNYDARLIEELALEGLVELSEEGKRVSLTASGQTQARRIIRAHRIGERLIYDVFGGDFETAACEFEHTVAGELVDGICTLLGHPQECPHGMPIPEGECCKSLARTAQRQVISLAEMEVGETARVAHINVRHDREMHKLDGLQIRPRATVKLHQQYPCYVIECEGAHIALDEDIVSSICVWSNNGHGHSEEPEPVEPGEKRRRRWGGGFLFGRKRPDKSGVGRKRPD
jgi:DtxR family Mn-dependent transcriptional regulator